ncbi:iron-containing alcohol dehydrogenase family protein [Sinomonas sp. G460-2]|uniref:iron-containing alcohol dehydrogenase family protein n=1 Tax=Sinomonas sp. G460-2 TaxID=3393464 RepID=UPI0039EF8F93
MNAPAIDLRHSTPAGTIYAGPRSMAALGRELERARCRSVVVVTSPSLADAPSYRLVVETVGNRIAGAFTRVRQFSPTDVVTELANVIAQAEADALVVLGGGSAMVTARAATVLAGESRPLEELLTRRDDHGKVINPRMPQPKLPIWIVPSTPTPAMAKAGAALRDPVMGRRVAVFDPKVRAAGIVLDPTVLSSSPAGLFVATAMNGLSMGVEGLLATSGDPFAEALLFQGVREIVANLGAVAEHTDQFEPRARVAMGAILAGQGSDYSGAGLALALSHELAPKSTVAGGVVETILLPHTVRFTAAVVAHRVPVVAAALGAVEHTIDGIEIALRQFGEALGLPERLSQIGLTEPNLQAALEHAVEDWAMNARMPRRAGLDDLEMIVDSAW